MQTECVFQPGDVPRRTFDIRTDAYGVVVQDRESGLAVTLDYDGKEIKAIITAEGQDEPAIIHTLKLKGS